jgi:RNA polymerase sigma factor (sigma-70 family)
MATQDFHGLEPLLDRARAGDGRAFNELLARLRPYLHSIVRERLGCMPDGRIDRSAIVQSVLRRFVINFPKLEGPGVPPILGWVATVARRRVVDELTRIGREPDLLGSAVVFVCDPKPSAESQARADLVAKVASALTRLPTREQRVVKTKWFDPQPDEKTAQDLGITVNHVHQLRFRALDKLREMLGGVVEATR